ncbi:hypothetical protein GWI33_021548 [Rhynchophorus ferrugineus]|uniref:LYR motif-containing protein 9 n=1 Tax=Rhynchophorus ferrugineus TaxID=354439 RepID=A0A834MMX7_RHYFE|nr:hypothetical protein GWI33_021548 [Rhynchophorus ferrugineus]
MFKISQIKSLATKVSSYDGKKLYKYLLRQSQKLPKGPKEHYQFMIKQSFKQHVNETDSERIKQIIERSYEDCQWILKKVH